MSETRPSSIRKGDKSSPLPGGIFMSFGGPDHGVLYWDMQVGPLDIVSGQSCGTVRGYCPLNPIVVNERAFQAAYTARHGKEAYEQLMRRMPPPLPPPPLPPPPPPSPLP